jgi:hypothetical protein
MMKLEKECAATQQQNKLLNDVRLIKLHLSNKGTQTKAG